MGFGARAPPDLGQTREHLLHADDNRRNEGQALPGATPLASRDRRRDEDIMTAAGPGVALPEPDRPEHVSGKNARSLLFIGAASGVLYGVVEITQRAIQQRPSAGALGAVPVAFGLYLLATIGLFALFAVLLRMCRRGAINARRTLVLALGFPVLFNVLFVLTPPNLSIDLLSYISHGYIRANLDGNPYIDPSSIVANTPLGPELSRYGWRPVHPVSPYGPAWTHIETAAAEAFDGVRAQMVALKLVVVASSLGNALLIWKITGRVRPEHQLFGALAYLWNPVVIVEIAGEGHNDAVMVFFVLLSLFLIIRERSSGSVIALSLGVLIKYLPVLLAPPQAVYLWRTRHRTARLIAHIAAGAAIAAVLTVASFAQLWAGVDTWRGVRLTAGLGDTGSTPTVVVEVMSRVVPVAAAEPAMFALLIAGFAAFLWVRASSVVDAGSLLRACASIVLVYLLFVSPSYWPWYAVLPIALMALVPTSAFLPVLIAISAGSRCVAPLDVMFVHGAIGRRLFLLLTWGGGVGVSIVVLVACLASSSARKRSIA
jgi:alpha-1,6-mannosyltransferase